MDCCLRLMGVEDIAQVTEIDREAFPTQWPAVNYHRELRNRLAHYIVACDRKEMVEETEPEVIPQVGTPGLFARLRQFFNRNHFQGRLTSSGGGCILGFAGFWIMAGEAHVTSIAVREKYRHQGMGELLLISLIDLAAKLNARLITLEVRLSNTAAQQLYAKGGFVRVGLHRGYYTDNGEDAVVMSLENVTSTPVQANLQRLKRAHWQRWGQATYQVA